MAIEKILVVDDELLMRNFLTEALRRKNFDVYSAENGQKALELLKENSFDLVITDMKMPDMTGMDVLKKTKEISPSTLVVVITAYGSIENAVEAMKLGAFHYLLKPFSADSLEAIIEKAKEHLSLVQENQYLRQQVNSGPGRTEFSLVAESPIMKKILSDVVRIAKSNSAVFINGESGTGKELIAHAIHTNSLRVNRPFIKVNCAAVPETLIESEFFGHEKGSFTGANSRRIGRFELANGGTLLLDEVSEIPIMLQAKLLRVVQEMEFERVGGSKPIKIDVRLISTTNRNIKDMIDHKILREDLFYRLNVVPIHIPPLRERKEDIIPLAEYFLKRMSLENHKENKKFAEEAKRKLLNYDWPGNVRELANIIERAIVMDSSSIIAPEHLYIEKHLEKPGNVKETTKSVEINPGISLKELEKKLIIETLQSQNQNRTKTAQVLGISLRTLRNKLKEYQSQE